MSEPFLPGTKLEIEFPSDNLQVPPGTPFCIWRYSEREQIKKTT